MHYRIEYLSKSIWFIISALMLVSPLTSFFQKRENHVLTEGNHIIENFHLICISFSSCITGVLVLLSKIEIYLIFDFFNYPSFYSFINLFSWLITLLIISVFDFFNMKGRLSIIKFLGVALKNFFILLIIIFVGFVIPIQH